MKSAMFIYFLLVCSVNLVSGKHFLYTYFLLTRNVSQFSFSSRKIIIIIIIIIIFNIYIAHFL